MHKKKTDENIIRLKCVFKTTKNSVRRVLYILFKTNNKLNDSFLSLLLNELSSSYFLNNFMLHIRFGCYNSQEESSRPTCRSLVLITIYKFQNMRNPYKF